ncbi:MAG: hypothetical protein DRO10_00950 [Thermoprotei archaeon]|nr:MAG: hypothetical protein DRO10_00950 [Thermoprotei archaeon]
MIGIKVWLDAQTSKQSTLLGHIANHLTREGHEVLFTCREYEYTVKAAERLGLNPIVAGKYSEGGPKEKVEADIERMEKLLHIVSEFGPELLIAYPNPPAARVAYGIGIKYLALTDSPHAEIPSRLSLPLATAVIFSAAIPKKLVTRFMYQEALAVQYEGVDELIWLYRSRPRKEYIESLGLRSKEYVVFRPREFMATYYKGLRREVCIEDIVHVVSEAGLTPVILPRYSAHKELIRSLKDEGIDVQTIEGSYDGVSLTYFARAVVTGGATLAREAALLMTTGITYFPQELHVNEYIRSKGYPLYKASSTEEIVNLIMGAPRTVKDFDEIISKWRKDFQDPLHVVLEIVNGWSA